jgi:hypothetical protein
LGSWLLPAHRHIHGPLWNQKKNEAFHMPSYGQPVSTHFLFGEFGFSLVPLGLISFSQYSIPGWWKILLRKGTADEVKFLVEFISRLVCHSSSKADTELLNHSILHVL